MISQVWRPESKWVQGQGGNQGLLDGIEGDLVIGQPAEGDAFVKEIVEDMGKGREVRDEVLELVAKAKETPDGSDVGGDGKVRNGLEVLCARLNAGTMIQCIQQIPLRH